MDFGLDALEVAKVGGGGVFGALLMLVLKNLSRNDEKVVRAIDRLEGAVAAVSQQMAVFVATSQHRDATVAALQTTVTDHGKQLVRHEADISALKATRGGK